MTEKRYEVGLQLVNKVVGESGSHTCDFLKGIAPDFERFLVEFPYGDIYSRPGLDLKSREIATVANGSLCWFPRRFKWTEWAMEVFITRNL